uniref:Uncharacterized protein n=1 Tax=Cannabis sativa TaxID=3483 RepID=A0A803PUZ5_CANSA
MDEARMCLAVKGNKLRAKMYYDLLVEVDKVMVANTSWLGEYQWPNSIEDLLERAAGCAAGLLLWPLVFVCIWLVFE